MEEEKDIMEFCYDLKIPKERVAVLIGKSGIVKKEIEEETRTLINVNSKEGEVNITGKDSLLLYNAREIIKAIGRGFNPDLALLLLKQDYSFELINLSDYVKTKSSEVRLKGRVIGYEGKSRRTIESLTEAHICVYGKTVGIIARAEWIAIARKAIESLLQGSPHSNVYKWLEKQRRMIKQEEFYSKKIEDDII